MQKGCPKCGRMIDENLATCPYCNYSFEEINSLFKKVWQKTVVDNKKYAGLIQRLVSGLIDIYIVGFVTYVLTYILNKYITMDYKIIFSILFLFIYIISLSTLERTNWHGSIGKKLIGIEVVDEYENPITFSRALFRNFAKVINVLTLGIGFIMCVIPPRKQTIGDKITKTYVINTVSLNEEKTHDYASAATRFLAYLIDLAIIFLISYAIVYFYSYISTKITYPDLLLEHETIFKNCIPIIAYLVYFPYNERHRGKTVGKRYVHISVTDTEENKISFTKSLIRVVLIILDIITLGFLLAPFHKKKQTVKDIITKTIIIND